MSTQFDLVYRPRTLDKIIGQETLVTRLQGIISSGKYPNAMLFVGPSSAGKTTLARAAVAQMFGVDDVEGNQDYLEINGADSRGIDDLRQLLKVAALRPRVALRRVILIDEAQQLTGPSAQLILKPLEKPSGHVLWILCSMEPEKLLQAVKNRCSQFVLQAPEKKHLVKFIKRIAKAERMDYITDEIASKVADNSNGELRSAAHLLEAVQQSVAGSGKKKVTDEMILEALSSTESVDDMLAVRILGAVYANKFRIVQKDLLDVQDGFKMIGTLLRLNSFLMNALVLKGEQHKAVWWSQQNKDLKEAVSAHGKIDPKRALDAYAAVQSQLIDLRIQSSGFMVTEQTMISNAMYKAIAALKPYFLKDKND